MILQHAIEQAGSIDPEKVTAALNATDVTTFFGHVKFATDPGHHGLQVAHADGAGAVADGERQARPAGGLADGGAVGEHALPNLRNALTAGEDRRRAAGLTPAV